jgi:hypothetical protein
VFGAVGIVLAIVGIRTGTKREQNALLLAWLVLPVLRVMLPKVHDYDGVRHFIEYSVPLGVLTALGLVSITTWLRNKLSVRLAAPWAIALALLVGSALPFVWGYRLVAIHPHQLVYFNMLTGGARGAQENWDDATDYWGSSYRQATAWLNDNAERAAVVTVPVASHIMFSTRSLWLRDDIQLLAGPMERIDLNRLRRLYRLVRHPERPIYFAYITRRNWYTDIVHLLEARAEPAHVISADGAPIIKIFRFDSMSAAASELGIADSRGG